MTTAVRPDSHLADYTDVPHLVRSGVKLGVMQSVIVFLFALVSNRLSGPPELALDSLLLAVGVGATIVLPGAWTRARTIEGIAGGAGIGLIAAGTFLVIDVALFQPLGIYSNRWLEIGGGSNWWYHPVWWTVGTYLAWMGSWVQANQSAKSGAPAALRVARDGREHGGVGRADVRAAQQRPVTHERVRGDGAGTALEADAGAQVEGERAAVGRRRPAAGDRGHDPKRGRIDVHQPGEHVSLHREAGLVAAEQRRHRDRIGGQPVAERASVNWSGLRRGRHLGAAPATDRDKCQQHRREDETASAAVGQSPEDGRVRGSAAIARATR